MKKLIKEPVLQMFGETAVVSEALYGHLVTELSPLDETWSLIETAEGYRGRVKREGLIDDRPLWRLSNDLVTVVAIGGLIYPSPKIQGPAFLRLSYGSKLRRLQVIEGWTEVELVTQETGWIQNGDLTHQRQALLPLSRRFVGLPYIWGGCSSLGYDCSGFVQMLYREIGLLLPRDSYQQVEADLLETVESPLPGDLLFFGDERVNHVGLYLGNGELIHATPPALRIDPLEKVRRPLIAIRRAKPVAFKAAITPLKERPHSWQEESPIPMEALCRISLNHYDFDGLVKEGELVVHKRVADNVVEIFKELFETGYPIEKIALIDRYGSDDLLSTSDNNTSAYCCRRVTGRDEEWSLHSYGLAIDINPLLNPYQRGQTVVPTQGAPFLDRSISCRGVIRQDDSCHRAFAKRGWSWGGQWGDSRGYVDYQHFYLY